jgi:hypothetical protein
MSDKKDLTKPSSASSGATIDRFLADASLLSTATAAKPRLVFALDATMSRQPTWDLACRVQGEMFDAAASVGGLSVQLVYFRGFNECRASGWVLDPQALTRLMTRIDCRGGHTQIRRVLRHVAGESRRSPVKVLVYVGDAMEEPVDELCGLAGELGLLGIKAFMFHEGRDPTAGAAFREIARLTGGVYAGFDANAPNALRDLLRAAAAYAARGVQGLTLLSRESDTARQLLVSMQERSG